MRTTKLGAVLASLTITATTAALLGAGPAQAATPTKATLFVSGETTITETYGADHGGLYGQVTDGDNNFVDYGSAMLQNRLPGKNWKDVKSDDTPGSTSFGNYGSHSLGNIRYRVHYLGGTDGTTTWDPSYSNVVTIRTQWNLHEGGTCVGGCRFFGKLSPNARHHKVLIQVKHGSWKKYKVVKTDSRSHWNARVMATFGGGTYYRAVVGRANREIKTTSHVYRFYKIRTP
jgi:hypothetical protein